MMSIQGGKNARGNCWFDFCVESEKKGQVKKNLYDEKHGLGSLSDIFSSNDG